jgi:hypothetical protein
MGSAGERRAELLGAILRNSVINGNLVVDKFISQSNHVQAESTVNISKGDQA